MFSDPAKKIKNLGAFHLANILSLRFVRLLNKDISNKQRYIKQANKQPLSIDGQRLCRIKIS